MSSKPAKAQNADRKEYLRSLVGNKAMWTINPIVKARGESAKG